MRHIPTHQLRQGLIGPLVQRGGGQTNLQVNHGSNHTGYQWREEQNKTAYKLVSEGGKAMIKQGWDFALSHFRSIDPFAL